MNESEWIDSLHLREDDHKRRLWNANGAGLTADDTVAVTRGGGDSRVVPVITLEVFEEERSSFVMLDRRQAKKLHKWLKEWLEASK